MGVLFYWVNKIGANVIFSNKITNDVNSALKFNIISKH